MYLYFEDHSRSLWVLERKRIPHGGRIIKVYTSVGNPRVLLDKPGLTVIESNDSPFTTEIFTYPGRGTYTGPGIEDLIAGHRLPDLGNRIIRALFRFSNRPDTQFCHAAMELQRDRAWLIGSPLEDIDGISEASEAPDMRTLAIHLDVFLPQSLKRLGAIVPLDEPGRLVDLREGLILKGLENRRRGNPETR